MGERLFPSVQHKNMVQQLIETGAISGDLVTHWNRMAEKKKESEDLLKRAGDGDTDAM